MPEDLTHIYIHNGFLSCVLISPLPTNFFLFCHFWRKHRSFIHTGLKRGASIKERKRLSLFSKTGNSYHFQVFILVRHGGSGMSVGWWGLLGGWVFDVFFCRGRLRYRPGNSAISVFNEYNTSNSYIIKTTRKNYLQGWTKRARMIEISR